MHALEGLRDQKHQTRFVRSKVLNRQCLPSFAKGPWWHWCSRRCLHWRAGQTPQASVQEGGSLWLPYSCHDPQGQGSCASHGALSHNPHAAYGETHMITKKCQPAVVAHWHSASVEQQACIMSKAAQWLRQRAGAVSVQPVRMQSHSHCLILEQAQ